MAERQAEDPQSLNDHLETNHPTNPLYYDVSGKDPRILTASHIKGTLLQQCADNIDNYNI